MVASILILLLFLLCTFSQMLLEGNGPHQLAVSIYSSNTGNRNADFIKIVMRKAFIQ